MDYKICKGNYHTLGVETKHNITTFSIENKEHTESTLLLYPTDGTAPAQIPMVPDENQTDIYSVGICQLPGEAYHYKFRLGDKAVLDPYARVIVGRETWGDIKRKKENIKCGFENSPFDWKQDRLPAVPKQDMVMYKLHVRGFSMLQRLSEEEKGTFLGVERKLAYLKSLGVTTLELMPVYEFEELFAQDEFQKESFPKDKINYWGYTRGNYFAPKAAYLGTGKTAAELKRLIACLHRKKMECILEFYFDEKLNPYYIIDVLRYWSREYHVDGFHVICSAPMAELIAQDRYLSGRKLFFQWFPEEACQPQRREMELFSYNDGFLYGIRRFMNQQGGSVREFTDQMRRQQNHQGFVNYLASNNGFTLYDSFAYTQQHNEENGEENKDGIQWNYSCNCGEEGPSKKKQVNRLRERLIKNAFCTLFFGQGIPLIWMGDENGNSQNGNNNPYCQDNVTGWKSWDNTKRSRELYQFLKRLCELRRNYPMLRNPLPMEMNDYKRTGYPDLSYHGGNGWQMELGGNDRAIGMMYAGKYAEKSEKINDDYIYIGYNFSAVEQSLALPGLPKKYRWHSVLDTGAEDMFARHPMEKNGKSFVLKGQSVCMLAGGREE